jgi:mRNA-degrading endonuclease YafQ of YafQ-DinJ toxin-antitoxin module
MRQIEYKRSFDKSYHKLDRKNQVLAALAIETFLNGLEHQKMPAGLGLKRLEGDLWEIRADIRVRIAFRMSQNYIEFGLVGTHGTIRNYLKNF